MDLKLKSKLIDLDLDLENLLEIEALCRLNPKVSRETGGSEHIMRINFTYTSIGRFVMRIYFTYTRIGRMNFAQSLS